MSEINYINDLLKSLDLYSKSDNTFIPVPYPDSDSCFRDGIDSNGRPSRFIRIVEVTPDRHFCPHCGSLNHHESKGVRTIRLTHISHYHMRFILEIEYRRFQCKDCHRYFRSDIPFRFSDTRLSKSAAHACLLQMKENTALAVISRNLGLSKSSVYRLFFNHVEVKPRYYHLTPVISIDEFRATTDMGTFAFHLTDPVSGKTLDIIEDRKEACLRNYFMRIPYKERKKVKTIIMDMSGSFRSVMHKIFPNASIIADRFHYVKLFREALTRSRLDTCASLSDEILSKSIKRNMHIFDRYRKKLNSEKIWFDRHLKKHFTCKEYIEYVFDQEGTDKFYETYNIYQNLLNLIHEEHTDYKYELNRWLDNIFDRENIYCMSSAKNIRKNWFIPILKSLTEKAAYTRNNRSYETSFNNGFVESMNNKVKLVKRNAYGYRYFHNLRKRILIHLNFEFSFI